ncbi:glycosyltransferase family 32 protein [Zhongshania sp.]|jgi:hypothetical protein|uniref:glycosyltransferase family 32 protein n=1 Tax=Zhongshania sp. TaxID=1971902 RepID=UPI0039E4F638
MIPKIIHYCWFGGASKSVLIENCIKTWRQHFPDYEIRCWTENDFDVNSVDFVKEAYDRGKWAFVADYVRLYALNTIGGIYFDTDVEVKRCFPESWRGYRFYSAVELHPDLFYPAGEEKLDRNYLPKVAGTDINGFSVFSAVMAAEAGHPYVVDCLQKYRSISFIGDDGTLNTKKFIIGAILSEVAESYGFRYRNEHQSLESGVEIFPADVLVGNTALLTSESYVIHHVNGSWVDRSAYGQFLYKIRNWHPWLYPYIEFIYRVVRKLKRVLRGLWQ